MKQRITIVEVLENDWFKKGYKPPTFENDEIVLDDIDDIFNESGVTQVVLWHCILCMLRVVDMTFLMLQVTHNLVVEKREEGLASPASPVTMNAFELISKSQGLNLATLFEKQMVGYDLSIAQTSYVVTLMFLCNHPSEVFSLFCSFMNVN